MGRLLTATTLAALCLTLLPTPADADMIEIVTTNDGLGADAVVNGGTHADRNFGGRTDIIPKNGGSQNLNVSRKGYLRFELPFDSFTGPLTQAELSLSIVANEAPGNWTLAIFGLADGVTGDLAPGSGGWLEGTGASFDPLLNPDATDGSITWNNAPANVTNSPIGFDGEAELLGQLLITDQDGPGDIVTFSTPELLDFLNDSTSNNLVTLMFNRLESTPPNISFAAKEHATLAPPTLAPPTLSIAGPSPAVVPEPSSLALLGMGMAGLAGYARRRKPRAAG